MVLHIRRAATSRSEELNLAGRLFVREGIIGFVRTNSHTSARHGDGLGYIRIWATLPKRLVFWDGAPSISIGIRAMPRFSRVWVMFYDVDHPTGTKRRNRPL